MARASSTRRPRPPLEDVASTVPTRLSAANSGFVRVHQPVADRVILPIGPAVRIRYTSTTSFIVSYNQVTISDWFFVNGQLMVLEYENRVR